MTKRNLLAGARIFFGLLTFVALIAQLVVTIQIKFGIVNFFSFFTNLSNMFAGVMLIIGGVYLFQRREPTVTFEIVRGASVVAMALVGVVFSLLLRNADLGDLLPWVNIIHHYIMPVAVVADWLYQPPKVKLGLRQIAYWLIFPVVYVVYTLIRGPLAHFYPYPFFNPAQVGGYGGVALYSVGMLVGFIIGSLILMALANRLKPNVT